MNKQATLQFPKRFRIILSFIALALSLTIVLLSASLTAQAATQYRLAYWQLEEVAAPYADAIASHNGTCTNCPTADATGLAGTAQEFSASTMDTITVPASFEFDWSASDNFSVELWVKAEPGVTCATANEVMVGRGTPGSGHWAIGCDSATGKARFELSDTAGNSVTLLSDRVITNGRWHHLVAGRDGVNGLSFLHLNATDSTTTAAVYETGPLVTTTADLTIGSINGGRFFNGLLDEVAIYGGAVPQTERYTHYYLSRRYTESCDTAVATMPLGDSITQGKSSGVLDESLMISYRKDLWDSLTGSDYDVDFVGSKINGQAYEGFDPNHEGEPGKTDKWVAINVYNFLTDNPADVVLLHIGTNERNDSDPEDVELILDEIDRYESDNNREVTVILARIINREQYHQLTSDYNNNVAAMAQARIDNESDKIIIVDMENGAGLIYDLQTSGGDMYNYLHPFANGYTKMAVVWESTLATFLPPCALVSPAINLIDDATADIDRLYQHQVVSTGNPLPTFNLLESPEGMTINSSSGLIAWTPTDSQGGLHNVTVQATNSEGEDTESFTIEVLIPDLTITKSPDIQLLDSGDPATFTVAITNTGTVTLNLAVADPQEPGCESALPATSLAPAENLSYTCTTTNVLQDFTNVITATGAYTPATGGPISVTASDTAVVDVRPTIELAQNVSPSSLPEPGSTVNVSLTITNTSQEPVTLTALTTTPFGNVTDPGNGAITTTNCTKATISGSGVYTCSFSAIFSSQPGEYNLDSMATGEDDEDNEASAGTNSTLSVTNLASSIDVTLTAVPFTIPEPGGPTNFTVTVSNTSLSDSITINGLNDQLLGSLNGKGSCSLPTVWLAPGSVYQCTFTVMISGVTGENIANQVTASGEDDDGDLVGGNSAVSTIAIDDKTILIFLPIITSGN
ncbi:MAG: putative Ig domain-containing protein [Anaerolineaceae bacterium]|nr:putative Ig domain-containing protein [Anaerolineaceae bacterium]